MTKKYLMVKYHGIDSAMYTSKNDEVDGIRTAKLFYSRASALWADDIKGKRAGSIVDIGDGYLVMIKDGMEAFIDYHEAELLKLLLQEIDDCNMKVTKLKETA